MGACPIPLALTCLLAGCAAGQGSDRPSSDAGPTPPIDGWAPGDAGGDAGAPPDAAPSVPPDASDHDATPPLPDLSVPDGASPVAPDADLPPDDRAFLHANLWSTWWNDRTRCGAEITFLQICRQRGGDCGVYERAAAACDPNQMVYGQVGPEKQQERLCRRGRFPDVGGCDARRFDFETLRYWWYGAEWQGNWPFATLKIFPAGTDDPRAWQGAGLLAISSLPGRAEAAMAGLPNSPGCVMLGSTEGDAAYQTPFGGFAWIEVPVGQPVRVLAATGTNFANRPFEGCGRGERTQEPWVTDPPGALLGCVYVIDTVFEAGRHYWLEHGQISALPEPGPPEQLVTAFARENGPDVRTPAPCGLR